MLCIIITLAMQNSLLTRLFHSKATLKSNFNLIIVLPGERFGNAISIGIEIC